MKDLAPKAYMEKSEVLRSDPVARYALGAAVQAVEESGVIGTLVLAVADRVWMLENAVYSVISPEGCASILWKDAAKAETAAENLKLTASDALTLGIIERIIEESDLGLDSFYTRLRAMLSSERHILTQQADLTARRYDHFRLMGAPISEKDKDL